MARTRKVPVRLPRTTVTASYHFPGRPDVRTDVVVGEQTRWTPDGTQPPTPLPVFADPRAGLVTGTTTGSGEVDADSYAPVAAVAKPVHVDRDAAKAMLEAVEADGPPPSGKPVK